MQMIQYINVKMCTFKLEDFFLSIFLLWFTLKCNTYAVLIQTFC